jgi:hypothetical protein
MSELSLVEFFIVGVVLVIPFFFIFKKAGYKHYVLSALLMLVPLLNIFVLYYLAFAKWPITNEWEEFLMFKIWRGNQKREKGG